MGVVGETVTDDNHERSNGTRHRQHRVIHIPVGVDRVFLDDIGSRQVRDEQSRYEPCNSSHGLTVTITNLAASSDYGDNRLQDVSGHLADLFRMWSVAAGADREVRGAIHFSLASVRPG